MNESQEPTPETSEKTPNQPSQFSKSAPNDDFDRTTMIAFGLLFVLPAVIIVFTVLFFLPYMLNTLTAEPSGVTMSAPNVLPPSNR